MLDLGVGSFGGFFSIVCWSCHLDFVDGLDMFFVVGVTDGSLCSGSFFSSERSWFVILLCGNFVGDVVRTLLMSFVHFFAGILGY